jgi:hypothetical protein
MFPFWKQLDKGDRTMSDNEKAFNDFIFDYLRFSDQATIASDNNNYTRAAALAAMAQAAATAALAVATMAKKETGQ